MASSSPDVLPDVSPTHGTTRGWRNRLNNRWTVPFSILIVLVGAVFFAGMKAGAWLVVEDPLEPAQVMVVLSGRMPERAIEAARLYKQKAAPQVWVSQGSGPVAQLAEMHIPYVGEDFYNERVLIALGVPADTIRVLPEPSANTAQEIEEISRVARQSNMRSVIIVTSAPHTRRVRAIWNRLVGSSLRLIVRHPVDDSFDAAHWWRNTQDALDVVREWLGMANTWAGFPSRPKPH
jgi:uncharacterized SAM-binding protein YcdF (DUF218 family)